MASKKSSTKPNSQTGFRFQLKVTLRGSRPPIWRRILVPAECSLEHLHYAIQNAMGWENDHLHAFELGGEEFMGRSPMGDAMDSGGFDAASYRLCDVAEEKSKFTYEYDFGDSWDHAITVEKIVPPLVLKDGSKRPQLFECVAGKGACPPEDCGGLWGYYELLAVLEDPKDEDHEEKKEWYGEFDPEAFDLKAANKRLASLKM